MTNSKPIHIRASDEIKEAFRAYCEPRGITISDFLRDNGLRRIGREDLIGTMRGRGKPKKPPEAKQRRG